MQIKYRQRHKTDPAKDHYWGFIDSEYIEPYLAGCNNFHDNHCCLSTCLTALDDGVAPHCTCGGYVPPEESEQFTGKPDKKGTEIYDGDEVRALIEGVLCIGIIEWQASQSAWKVHISNPPHRRGCRFMYEFSVDDIEVIPRTKK